MPYFNFENGIINVDFVDTKDAFTSVTKPNLLSPYTLWEPLKWTLLLKLETYTRQYKNKILSPTYNAANFRNFSSLSGF